MKRLLLILALALLASGAAHSETATVRSGRHNGFTRLVITLKSPSGWMLGRYEGGYEFRLSRRDVTFDLDAAFDRIARGRLTDLAPLPGGGRLRLDLACACYAKAFAFRPSILVIDIRDGRPPANSRFEKILPPFAPVSDTRVVDTAAPQTKPEGPYDWHKMGRDVAAAPIDLPAVPSARETAIRSARNTLLKQLARAGAQGLIEADPERLRLAAEDGAPPQASSPTDHSRDVPAAERPGGRDTSGHGLGLKAQTEMDRDTGQPASKEQTPEGHPCPPNPEFDVAKWGDASRPAAQQIAERRSALLGEFDRPDAAAVASLAKLYLNLGFGAEARMVLNAFPVDLPSKDRLRALSGIVDGDGAVATDAVAGFSACGGPVALWSMLASPAPAPTATVDRGAVLRSFSVLPARLRRQVGPALAQRFLDRGDTDASLAIRNAIARVRPADDTTVDVLDARLDVAQGKRGQADTRLSKVVDENGLRAPKALALLVENRVAMGRPVGTAVIQKIETMLHDNRGTPIGRALGRAYVLALGSDDRFDAAFRELAARRDDLDPATGPALWALLAQRGSDESLLDHALARPGQALPGQTRLTIARRLLGLGFGAAAKDWIAQMTLSDAARLGLAKEAVGAGRGDLALLYLDGLDGPEARGLAAQAYGLTGNYAAQAKAFAALDAPDKQGDAAWRAGDWAHAVTGPDGARRDAISLAEGHPPAASPGGAPAPGTAPARDSGADAPAGPLARGKKLLEDSAAARARIEKLLADAPPPGN